MEKRTFLAIALSMLILVFWSVLVPKPRPPLPPTATQQPEKIATVAIPETLPDQAVLKFNQEEFETVFVEAQAAIKEVIFKDYQSWGFHLGQGFLLLEPSLNFRQDSRKAKHSLSFTASDNFWRITKRFLFHNSSYTIELDIEIQNVSSQTLPLNLALSLGALNFSRNQAEARFQDVTVGLPDKPLHPNVRKDLSVPNVNFLALRDRYFCSIIEPLAENNYTAFIKKINPQESEIGLAAPETTLAAGQKIIRRFRIYLGPQELHRINQIEPAWSAVMYYGTFNFIAHILQRLLEFFYGLVHNWGLAIIILSVLIYFVLFPLSLKQMRSMKAMQALQPRLEELKKAHKDNPQKLNKEIMELYREHKVNPLGGCLPMILQIPIFFALYQTLIRSIALKGAKFLWIKDLSKPDSLVSLPASLPIKEINLLPILMTASMIIQQKITSANVAGGSSSEQQKLMLILMPLMFLFIFYGMPAGLVLYWLVNSTLMLAYQFKINRQE